MVPIDALKRVSIFETLEDSLLRLLAVRSHVHVFAPGESLMREGDEGKSLHILLEGRVAIERSQEAGNAVRVAERGEGECFGEMSLIDGERRSATVVALSECKVLVVSQDTFEQIVLGHPRAALSVMATLVQRLREQTGALAATQ